MLLKVHVLLRANITRRCFRCNVDIRLGETLPININTRLDFENKLIPVCRAYLGMGQNIENSNKNCSQIKASQNCLRNNIRFYFDLITSIIEQI